MSKDRTRLTQAQLKKVAEKVSAIEPELPLLVAVMNKTNVRPRRRRPYLSIRMDYASMYLIKKSATGHDGEKTAISLVLQREEMSRKWDTELRCKSGHMRISKGWASLARANSLREDDICLFMPMKNKEPLKMMVYIIPRDDNC